MTNSNKEIELMTYLASKREFTTASELAYLLNTSTKTIYRNVKRINQSNKNEIIISEKGKGLKIDYNQYLAVKEKYSMHDQSYSPIERCNGVLKELLLIAPNEINVNNLYQKYYVSDTVIFNDEKIIIEILNGFNLKFKRKNKLVSITGDERNIREALRNIATDINSLDYTQLRFNDDVEINNLDMNFVVNQLKYIESIMNTEIPYPYDVNIFSHLYIIINRVRKRQYIKTDILDFPTKSEAKVIEDNRMIYKIAEEVISNLEDYLEIKLSNEETYHLFQYLLSSRLRKITREKTEPTGLVCEITNIYINKIFDDTSGTLEIYNELAQHIKPMLNRLNNGIIIRNKLLDSIKMEYTTLYENVVSVSSYISQEYSLPPISEDENGYITLYFARMMEQNPPKIRTLIMCTSGLGTSELLKVKIGKKIPNIEVVDVISMRDVDNCLKNRTDIDLIISTVSMNLELEVPLVVVGAMFNQIDQQNVAEVIRTLQ